MNMHTNPSIFKAYDIRGIYGTDLTDQTAYRLGKAFGQFLKKINPGKDNLRIVVGRDMRDSGVKLEDELIKGLNFEGVSVVKIGLTSTPMMYYAVLEYEADGGVSVTASHNPGEYNGFKLVGKLAMPISGDTGVYEMRDMVMDDSILEGEDLSATVHNEEKTDTLDTYIASILEYQDPSVEIPQMKVVVDSANGMASPAIDAFFKHFPQLEVTHMYSELDGSFPNHEANPLKEDTLVALKKEIAEQGADLGIACDGDFDRVAFVDNEGNTIRADITTALLAPKFLETRPGETVLYDLRSSNITPETIKKAGGVAHMCRVGHSFIKAQMREQESFFSGEFSGHFYLQMEKDGEYAYFENPLFVVIKILEVLAGTDTTLADLTRDLFVYTHSGEINFEVSRDKDEIIQEIKETLTGGKLTEIDGVRIDFEDAWVSVRASNTEPVLRLIVEGKTPEAMEELKSKVQTMIEG
jgi:phosphomannomutase